MNKKASDFNPEDKVGRLLLAMKGKVIYTSHPDGDEVIIVLWADGLVEKVNCNDVILVDDD